MSPALRRALDALDALDARARRQKILCHVSEGAALALLLLGFVAVWIATGP